MYIDNLTEREELSAWQVQPCGMGAHVAFICGRLGLIMQTCGPCKAYAASCCLQAAIYLVTVQQANSLESTTVPQWKSLQKLSTMLPVSLSYSISASTFCFTTQNPRVSAGLLQADGHHEQQHNSSLATRCIRCALATAIFQLHMDCSELFHP